MLGETVGSIVVTQSGYLISRTINLLPTSIIQYPETRITHINLISTTTPSNLQIANGQGGTVLINVTGTAGTETDFDYGTWGITFPKGAYVTVDANIVTAAITCKAEKF